VSCRVRNHQVGSTGAATSESSTNSALFSESVPKFAGESSIMYEPKLKFAF
jgi:hypothetical protein